jgi:hypothetical protein
MAFVGTAVSVVVLLAFLGILFDTYFNWVPKGEYQALLAAYVPLRKAEDLRQAEAALSKKTADGVPNCS